MEEGRVEGLEVGEGIAVARIMGPQAKKKKLQPRRRVAVPGDGRTDERTFKTRAREAQHGPARSRRGSRPLREGARARRQVKIQHRAWALEVFDMHHQVGARTGRSRWHGRETGPGTTEETRGAQRQDGDDGWNWERFWSD